MDVRPRHEAPFQTRPDRRRVHVDHHLGDFLTANLSVVPYALVNMNDTPMALVFTATPRTAT